MLSSGKSKLVAASPHCLPKPRCICASQAATAHLCLCCQSTFVQRHGSVPPLVCLTMPHNGGECPAAPHCPVEVGVGSKARKWPGAPVCEAPDQAFSQAETTESLLSEGPLGLRHERGTERLVLGTGGDSLPVGNESAVTPLSSSFVHLSLKVDLRLIFLWRAVTNVPYIEGPVVLCIVGNNSGFPS